MRIVSMNIAHHTRYCVSPEMLYNYILYFTNTTRYIKYCALDMVCTISNTASHLILCIIPDTVSWILYIISNHYIIYHVSDIMQYIKYCVLNLLFIYYALYTIKYRHKVLLFHFQKIFHNNWRITKLNFVLNPTVVYRKISIHQYFHFHFHSSSRILWNTNVLSNI